MPDRIGNFIGRAPCCNLWELIGGGGGSGGTSDRVDAGKLEILEDFSNSESKNVKMSN